MYLVYSVVANYEKQLVAMHYWKRV